MFGTKRLFELGYFWMVDINAFKCFNNTELWCVELKALMAHERMFSRWKKSTVNFNKTACNFRIIIFWFACFNLDYGDYSLLEILCSGGLHDLNILYHYIIETPTANVRVEERWWRREVHLRTLSSCYRFDVQILILNRFITLMVIV